MSTAAPLQNTASKSQTLGKPAQAGLLLQRKCACGRSASSSLAGECEKCKQKRLQKKLSIGASNDPLEQEADRVADQVIAMSPNRDVSSAPLRIQRFTGQATGGDAPTAPPSVDRVLAGSGRPLDSTLQQDMGQRFGHDFSTVRVHTGSSAEQSARDVNAHAYAVGNNVVFGAGKFEPESHAGRKMIAHELTHVVQQAGVSKNAAVLQRDETKGSESKADTEKDKGDHSKLNLQLTEPNFLSMRKPFFNWNAAHLWEPNSALSVWKFNVNFFKTFGFTEDWARKAANLTAPLAIDSQLKSGNPTWWEMTDRELKTTSLTLPVPLFSFDANFMNWKALPFLRK